MHHISWPEGKAFAFTVFDDPDAQTLEAGSLVYSFLEDLGLRTTKGVWPLAPTRERSDKGGSCGDAGYLAWIEDLLARGFEIGLHNAACHTSTRTETARGLDRFREIVGHDPWTMANHFFCDENIYWGDRRVSGLRRVAYNALTRGTNRKRFFGEVAGHPLYWGDLCESRIQYVRNFVYRTIDTLERCPMMPYHDPDRPLVRAWFASSEGANVGLFNERISPSNQDLLEERGGACIMYTHFGHGFVTDGKLDPGFVRLMTSLASRNGWFVPVSELLQFLERKQGLHTLTRRDRVRLERRWLLEKMRYGTS